MMWSSEMHLKAAEYGIDAWFFEVGLYQYYNFIRQIQRNSLRGKMISRISSFIFIFNRILNLALLQYLRSQQIQIMKMFILLLAVLIISSAFQIKQKNKLGQATSTAQIYYTLVAAPSIKLSRGANANVSVNVSFEGLSQTDLETFTSNFASTYGYSNQYSQALSEKKVNDGLHFIFGFLSLCSGNTYADGYQQSEINIDLSSQVTKQYFTLLVNQHVKEKQVAGKLLVSGTSLIPSQIGVFAEILVIILKGNQLQIVSGFNPKIYNRQGSMRTGTTSDNLEVIDRAER